VAHVTQNERRAFEIEQAAWNALNEIGATDEVDFPLSLTKLAARWDIPVQEVQFRDPRISGIISRNNGGAVILVNERDTTVRKRFTIAHELGHYVLHWSRSTDGPPDDRVDTERILFGASLLSKEDREANRFASALLIPAPILSKMLEHGGNRMTDLLGAFGVSEEVLRIRIRMIRRRPWLLHEVKTATQYPLDAR